MVGPTSIELTPKALFDASVAALEARQLMQARAGFEALRRNPALWVDALHMLGVIAGLEGNHLGAASLIREAIAVNRNRPDFYHNLALALANAGKHDEARMARNDMGIALHVTKQYREAVSVFEQILADTPDHLVTLVDIAASLNELGDYDRAMICTARVLSKLFDRDPRVAAVLEQVRMKLPEVYEAATQSIAAPNADITGEERPLLLPRAGLDWAQALAEDWQLRVRLNVQHTEEMLVAPEQFGIGGANSVRGFLERERSDDRGHSGTLELYTPELAPSLGMKDWNARALAFYDFGRIARVDPLPGEQVREGIASAGLGLRLALQKSFSLRFDLAQILDPGGTRERNHFRFAFGTVWWF